MGIILYIMLSFLRNYSLCKIKWLLDYKYVNTSAFLIVYNLIVRYQNHQGENFKCLVLQP